MESIAEPGTIYITGATARLVEGFFETENLGGIRVKGKTEPVRIFELRGEGAPSEDEKVFVATFHAGLDAMERELPPPGRYRITDGDRAAIQRLLALGTLETRTAVGML